MSATVLRLTVLLPVTGEERLRAAQGVLADLSKTFPGGTCLAGDAGASVVRGWWRATDKPSATWDKHWRVDVDTDLDARGNVLIDVDAVNHADKIAELFRTHYADDIAEVEVYVSTSTAVSHKFSGKIKASRTTTMGSAAASLIGAILAFLRD